MRAANRIKQFIILIGTAMAITLVSISSLQAQTGTQGTTGTGTQGPTGSTPLAGCSGSDCLVIIASNTAGILNQVNNLPNYLQGLGAFIVSWMTNDTSSTTQQMQGSFASIGSLLVQDSGMQLSLQPQLIATQFSPLPPASPITPANLSSPVTSPTSILKTVPNINDLSYATLLGSPPSPKASNVGQAPYNYIANASAITVPHIAPGSNWQGPVVDQFKYQNYYNTLMSIESFNAYVLSNQYAEAQSKHALTNAQNTLIAQASSSTWIAQIATEELGKVLRQLLMFQSQTYVLLTQLVQAQKQLVVAQVMNNSLLIASLQMGETVLVSRAQGVTPTG